MIPTGTILQCRYRVERELRRGGMGAVYLARDERLGNTVALKETLVHDAALRNQFVREACALANLRHPALAVVIDHFSESAGQFLVMQLIPGNDLDELLEDRGKPFSTAEVLSWADQLLDALEYLHSHNPPIIHRDIKPRNIKLTESGRIVLLDFGLAKGIQADMLGESAVDSIPGYTPRFAPVEQILARGTDERSDLYALGATLYQLLTGRMPVDAITRFNAVSKGEQDPLPTARSAGPLISDAFSALLEGAMALDPAQRPRSASTMRASLRTLTRPSTTEATVLDSHIPGARLPVFISTITPHDEVQKRFIDRLCERLLDIGIEAIFSRPTVFDRQDPMGTVRRQIEKCRGMIVLGLERTHVYYLRDREGTDRETEEIHRKYTSGWLHVEAGMANALGMDVFVLCQKDICSDGIFDRWWNSYPVCELPNLNDDSAQLQEFLNHLMTWSRRTASALRIS